MAGGFRRGNRQRLPKLEGRGELEAIEREGPFKEWLGMPPLSLPFGGGGRKVQLPN